MTYGKFKKESQKTELGRIIFDMWIRGEAPLVPIMNLFIKHVWNKKLTTEKSPKQTAMTL